MASDADGTRRTVLTPNVIRSALERLADILDGNGATARITVYVGRSQSISTPSAGTDLREGLRLLGSDVPLRAPVAIVAGR